MTEHDITISYKDVTVTLKKQIWLPDMMNSSLEGVRLRVEVTHADGNIPVELFLWERHRIFNNTDTRAKDRFMCVAKISDLTVYPPDDPDPSSSLPPFYRLNYFDLVIPTISDYQLTWNDVTNDVRSLIRSMVELELYVSEPDD